MSDKSTEEVQKAFSEFKEANDARLAKYDVLLEEKTDRLNKVLDQHETRNQELVKVQEQSANLQEQLDRLEASAGRPSRNGTGKDAAEVEAYRNAFDRSIRRSAENRDPADLAVLNKHRAALTKGDDPGAGYLLAPAEVNRDIIKDIIEHSPMRGLATVRNIGVASLKQPKRTAAAGAARRIGERETRVNTGDPAYGMLEFKADEMFARGEISQQMLEDADYDLGAELKGEFVEQFSLKEGIEHITGTGADGQCQGILSAQGVGEIKTGDASKLTSDGLIDAFYALKTAYTRNANWLLNRSTIASIRKLRDGDGNYLWTPGITGVVPNSILGATYVEMPAMPDVAAGAVPIVFGDFKRAYVIVDRIGLAILTDFITQADNGTVVYRARRRVGGGVRQEEAYKKVKIAAP